MAQTQRQYVDSLRNEAKRKFAQRCLAFYEGRSLELPQNHPNISLRVALSVINHLSALGKYGV
jgi:hypothetical protein